MLYTKSDRTGEQQEAWVCCRAYATTEGLLAVIVWQRTAKRRAGAGPAEAGRPASILQAREVRPTRPAADGAPQRIE
jgi:hypothetical protein